LAAIVWGGNKIFLYLGGNMRKIKPNLQLKMASLQKDERHYRSAANLNIRLDVFSSFLSGRIIPNEVLIRKFEMYFKKNRQELGY
jgi:hypothetical protein